MERFKARLMDEAAVSRALKRISHEIVEHNNGAENLCIRLKGGLLQKGGKEGGLFP